MSIISNRWHLRQVADAAAKPCFVCYKPSASVLITADSKDFFYVCKGHLGDKGFCTPLAAAPGNADPTASSSSSSSSTATAGAAAAATTHDAALQREIELVKQEYAAKQALKEEKNKKKKKEGDGEKGKEKAKEKGKGEEKEEGKGGEQGNDGEKQKDSKKGEKGKVGDVKSAAGDAPSLPAPQPPRIFALHKTFYQMRVERLRAAELARRNRERLTNPTLFPAAPRGDVV